MRFTIGDVRGAVVDRNALISRLRATRQATSPASTPRSPQRQWIEASLRRYYAANRNPDALIADYRARTAGKGTSPSKRAEIANGEGMLNAFLTIEEPEPAPRIAMLARSDQLVAGHIVAMGHDLVYELPDGYLIREVWTDGVIRRPNDRLLVLAASLLHAEQVLGEGRVRRAEAWQLRLGVTDRVSLADALARRSDLKRLFDSIAHSL